MKLLNNVKEREPSGDLQLQDLCEIIYLQAQSCTKPAIQEARDRTQLSADQAQ